MMRALPWVVAALLFAGCNSGSTSGAGGGTAGGFAGGKGGGSAGGIGGGSAGGGIGGGGSAGGFGGGGGSGGGMGDVGGGSSGAGGGSAGGSGGGAFDAGVPGVPFVYVGSGNGMITIYKLDRATGALTSQGNINGGSNPSFLAVDPQKRFLYAVNENSNAVLAFEINRSTGLLTSLNQQGSQGGGPAHVSVDQTGRWVFAANYGGGTVAVFPVRPDGGLGAPSDTDAPGANAHQIQSDPTNRYVFVPCLGVNKVFQYLFDADAGTLIPNAVPSLSTDPGAGPRHLALHPNGKFAYLINETASTLQALGFDGATGRLSPIQQVSTLPAGFSGTNTCAEVVVHPNGRYVFGSNRGDDSIVVFAINQQTGMLTLVGHTKTGGNQPRNFTIDPTGTVLLAANQTSSTVVSFRIDADAGTLTNLGQSKSVNTPAFVGVVELP